MINPGRAGAGFLDLHAAAAAGDVAKVKRWVVERNTPVDSRKEGYTPLHKAAISGKVDTIRELLTLGADIQAKSFANYTPLHFAAQHGHVEAVRCLLQNGAEVVAVLDNGKTAEDLAREKGFSDVIETIREETLTSIKVRYSTRVSRRMSAMNSGAGGTKDPRHPSYMKEKLSAANSADINLAVPAFDPSAGNRKSRRAALQMSDEDRAAALNPDEVLAQLNASANRRGVVSFQPPSPPASTTTTPATPPPPAPAPVFDVRSPRLADGTSPRPPEPPAVAAPASPPSPTVVVTPESTAPPTTPSPQMFQTKALGPAVLAVRAMHEEEEKKKKKKKLFDKISCNIL